MHSLSKLDVLSTKRNLWKKTLDVNINRQSTLSSTITDDESSVDKVTPVASSDQDRGYSQRGHSVRFIDGIRRIDFVLIYEENLHALKEDASLERQSRREFFQDNLTSIGLELEEDAHRRQATQTSPAKMSVFIKVHAPWSVLCRQAELLKMRMPLKLQDAFAGNLDTDGSVLVERSRHILSKLSSIFSNIFQRNRQPESNANSTDQSLTPKHPRPHRPSIWSVPFGNRKSPESSRNKHVTHVTWPFQRNRIDKYLLDDTETVFSPTQRIEIVWEILQRARNDPNDEKKRGIESLLGLGVYQTAFPLHDGNDDPPAIGRPVDEFTCDRHCLRNTWASWRCVVQAQPTELIRRYFGEKVAFYFTFLGFYTQMLIFPAFCGVGAFLYGVAYADDDDVVRSISDGSSDPGNRVMCPVCKFPYCDFSKLSQNCWNAIWAYRVDNEATLALACLTIVWATVFLKLWKRREAELAFEWDTHDVELEDSVVRPEYDERATSRRPNPVTKEIEPYVPASTRVCRLFLSCSVTAFMLCGVGASLFGLIFARIQLYGVLKRAGFQDYVEVSRWIVHGLTFVVVTVFEQLYSTIAEHITTWECPRTQSKWMSSYLWKVFVFQLLNSFVPVAYAAWIKGKTASVSNFSWSSELCEIGGCMSEATELIAVLLMARLIIGNTIEIGVPFLRKLWSRFRDRRAQRKENSRRADNESQWHQDVLLDSLAQDGVAREYMEIVIQFAFCTLFAPAFPAAPVISLLNNILEIRVDAINFVSAHRRALPMRVSGIEIWNCFLDIIAKLAVLCNAGLISFTSEIVPRLYYKYRLSPDGTFKGYPESTLWFAEKGLWLAADQKYFEKYNLTGCWYEDRLNDTAWLRSELSPDEEAEDQMWWEVMTMRIVVFAIFSTSSFTFQWLFNFIVPDIPAHVTTKIQRRRFVVMKSMETEIVYDRWLKHALATTSMKRVHTERILNAFISLGQQKAAEENLKNSEMTESEVEDEGEHLEPMTKEVMQEFVHKRRLAFQAKNH